MFYKKSCFCNEFLRKKGQKTSKNRFFSGFSKGKNTKNHAPFSSVRKKKTGKKQQKTHFLLQKPLFLGVLAGPHRGPFFSVF